MEKYDSIPSLNEQRASYRVFTVLVIITQVLAVAVTVMVAVWLGTYHNGFSWDLVTGTVFNYHPLFMILGMIVCYGHAILVYRIWRNQRKIYTKLLHAALHVLVLIFTGIGLKAVFDAHNAKNQSNVYSLHSWLGLITVGLFGFQWLAGFLTFLLPFASQAARACLKPMHVYFGVAIFLLAIATAMMGLTEKAIFGDQNGYTHHSSEGKLINCIGLTLVVMALISVFVVINPNYRRLPTPEEEEDRQTLQLTH